MGSVYTQDLPLSGVTVLELSSFVAAPLAGMTLAHLGADVIRIDPIGGASDRGRWPLTDRGTSLYWAGLNKGKRSIQLDLASERGQSLFRRLLTASGSRGGVVLSNLVGRPEFGYDRLREVRDDLIHVQVKGTPDGRPAVDYTVNATVGFPMVTGPGRLDDPVNHVLPAWDVACGLYAALGIVAGLNQRDRTGLGTSVEVALEDVAVAVAGHLGLLAEAELNGATRRRDGNHVYGTFGRDFISADGVRFMVVALTLRQWRDLVQACQLGPVIDAFASTFSTDLDQESARYEHREALGALIQQWFGRRSAGEVEHALAPTRVLWSRYGSFADVVSAAYEFAAHPVLAALDQPGIGRHLAPGSPLVLRRQRTGPMPAPIPSEHTAAVLQHLLGLGDDEIRELRVAGVVGECARREPA